MHKFIEMSCPNGTVFWIPMQVIAEHRSRTRPNEQVTDEVLIDWASNHMEWSEVESHTFIVRTSPCDMGETWREAPKSVVSVPKQLQTYTR